MTSKEYAIRCFIMDIARDPISPAFYLGYLCKIGHPGWSRHDIKMAIKALIVSGAIEPVSDPLPIAVFTSRFYNRSAVDNRIVYYKCADRALKLKTGGIRLGMSVTVVNGRAVGVRDDKQVGLTYGGVYYPEKTLDDGRIIAARFETTIMTKRCSSYNEAGEREYKFDYIGAVFWNTRSCHPGRGLADLAAKFISPGREVTFMANLHSFDKRLFVDGLLQLDHNGNARTTKAHQLMVSPGTLNLGAEGYKHLETEYMNWDNNPGVISFWARPRMTTPEYSIDNTELWNKIQSARMGSIWNGEPTYGYAIVRGG